MEPQDYNGYDLFLDVEDQELQTRNRAVVLWNIYEMNSKNGRTSPRGVSDMVGYVNALPGKERQATINKFRTILEEGEA